MTLFGLTPGETVVLVIRCLPQSCLGSVSNHYSCFVKSDMPSIAGTPASTHHDNQSYHGGLGVLQPVVAPSQGVEQSVSWSRHHVHPHPDNRWKLHFQELVATPVTTRDGGATQTLPSSTIWCVDKAIRTLDASAPITLGSPMLHPHLYSVDST